MRGAAVVPDNAVLRKARGAFFTPAEIAHFMTDWAVRSADDRVLEPSCGEASFLLSAGARLRTLGASRLFWGEQLHGVEIHQASAENANAVLAAERFDASIWVGDFFDREPSPTYDAVIGNPPYVRYQQFAGDARTKAIQAALTQGVRLTGLSSSWAAFTVHAARFLKPSGRLALVLPAELLTVNYAAEVRRFLLRRFSKIRLVMFDVRVFPDVEQEVVLLMAEGSGGAPCFEVFQARGVDQLPNIDTTSWAEFRPEFGGSKWTPALISPSIFSVYQKFSLGVGFESMIDWGETYLGAVTGNNKYFALSREKVRELGLPPTDLIRISPPGSRHLRGLSFTEKAWERLSNEGAASFLFYPATDDPRQSAQSYIESGRRKKVHKAYKCENRSPWWRVPMGEVPDLLFTYMNQDRPRLITNEAGVYITNSLYGVALKKDRRKLGRELLPIACLNSLTLLGAEMVGRSYGGGLLKMEPKEADVLPVPSLTTLTAVGERLKNVRHALSTALRNGDVLGAAEIVDRIVLTDHLKVTDADIFALRQARELLFQRRQARNRASGQG